MEGREFDHSDSEQGNVAGACDGGNEMSGSRKCCEFVD
jgi:hypothetical protein